MANPSQNDLAKKLRQLCKPGDPVLLTNVWDGTTAKIVSEHPDTKAVATASYAVAGALGLEDNDLTREDNVAAIRLIASIVSKKNLPLTADIQDGYEDVAETVKQVIEAGAVGGNIEDVDNTAGKLRSKDDAISRIKIALKAAADAGVPDFVVNARTDCLYLGSGSIEEAIDRGKAYLAAGATTVYVWGGPKGRGVSSDETRELVKGLGGMVNVKMNLRKGFLTRKDLAELGVARISIGPELFNKAMVTFKGALEGAVKGEKFE